MVPCTRKYGENAERRQQVKNGLEDGSSKLRVMRWVNQLGEMIVNQSKAQYCDDGTVSDILEEDSMGKNGSTKCR